MRTSRTSSIGWKGELAALALGALLGAGWEAAQIGLPTRLAHMAAQATHQVGETEARAPASRPA